MIFPTCLRMVAIHVPHAGILQMAADNELLIFVGAGAPTSQPIKLESVSASIRNHQSNSWLYFCIYEGGCIQRRIDLSLSNVLYWRRVVLILQVN